MNRKVGIDACRHTIYVWMLLLLYVANQQLVKCTKWAHVIRLWVTSCQSHFSRFIVTNLFFGIKLVGCIHGHTYTGYSPSCVGVWLCNRKKERQWCRKKKKKRAQRAGSAGSKVWAVTRRPHETSGMSLCTLKRHLEGTFGTVGGLTLAAACHTYLPHSLQLQTSWSTSETIRPEDTWLSLFTQALTVDVLKFTFALFFFPS